MIHKIKALSLLLSFMMVLGHMMIPHHHHGSLAEIEKANEEHISHTHHHGSNHHHHDHEKQDSDNEESNDQDVPQHFHFSTSDNFEPVRINKVDRVMGGQGQPSIAIITFFSWNSDDSIHILKYPFFWPERAATSQCKPGANGLRAPPSIA